MVCLVVNKSIFAHEYGLCCSVHSHWSSVNIIEAEFRWNLVLQQHFYKQQIHQEHSVASDETGQSGIHQDLRTVAGWSGTGSGSRGRGKLHDKDEIGDQHPQNLENKDKAVLQQIWSNITCI